MCFTAHVEQEVEDLSARWAGTITICWQRKVSEEGLRVGKWLSQMVPRLQGVISEASRFECKEIRLALSQGDQWLQGECPEPRRHGEERWEGVARLNGAGTQFWLYQEGVPMPEES